MLDVILRVSRVNSCGGLCHGVQKRGRVCVMCVSKVPCILGTAREHVVDLDVIVQGHVGFHQISGLISSTLTVPSTISVMFIMYHVSTLQPCAGLCTVNRVNRRGMKQKERENMQEKAGTEKQ